MEQRDRDIRPMLWMYRSVDLEGLDGRGLWKTKLVCAGRKLRL